MNTRRRHCDKVLHRRLHVERLEDRRMLAITVDTLVDELDGSIVDGDISLRDAVAAANFNETIDFSVTGTIQLDDALGEIAIDKSLTISGPGADLLTIDAGDGSDNTFGTGDGFRIFNIDNGSVTKYDIALNGLTLTGGDVSIIGGAIFSQENLTVTNSIIRGNSAGTSGGGIHALFGTTTIIASTISGNLAGTGFSGGGISVFDAALTITSSTISGNSAGEDGGGIDVTGGTTTITSSTIVENSAGIDGGGISANSSATTITSSTVSGNSAVRHGGGINASFGTTTIGFSTIIGNRADEVNNGSGRGGGIGIFVASVTLSHTIVAGNELGSNSDSDVHASVEASSDFNFIGVNTGLSGIINGISGNQIGTSGSPIDPLLAPLRNNGGPTQTHALLPASPALDAGDPLFDPNVFTPPLINDQRGDGFPGFQRVSNGRIDIGAFELATEAAIFFDDFLTTTFDPAKWELIANATIDTVGISEPSEPNAVRLDGNLFEGVDLITSAEIDLSTVPSADLSYFYQQREVFGEPGAGDDLILEYMNSSANWIELERQLGNGPAMTTFVESSLALPTDALHSSFRFRIRSASTLFVGDWFVDDIKVTVPIEHLDLVVDTLADESDGDFSSGDLSLREAIEMSNAIFGSDSITFDAALDGGTIDLQQTLGELSITDSLTIDASSLTAGLAIDAGDGADNIFNTGDGFLIFFISDSTDTAIDVTLRSLTLTGGDNNPAGGSSSFGQGGAIFSGETLTIENSTISGNAATAGGGGIAAQGTTTITSSTISGNAAGNEGGGIAVFNFKYAGPTTITFSTISENSAGIDGGGISFSSPGISTIADNLIINNHAGDDAGGLDLRSDQDGGTLHVRNNIITGNTASDDGGGVRLFNNDALPSTFVFSDNVVSQNTAARGGGVRARNLNHADNLIILQDNSISGNQATAGDGGGLRLVNESEGDILVLQNTISGNSATGDGGGVWSEATAGSTTTIVQSTIFNNETIAGAGGSNEGGGIFSFSGSIEITGSIVAGNTDVTGLAPDIGFDPLGIPFPGLPSLTFSLLGDSKGTLFVEAQTADVSGNLIGQSLASGGSGKIDPLLAPLALNGGLTSNHALLPGSPAIDAGDPSVLFDANEFDQRGQGFIRVVDGGVNGVRIDIGAFELQQATVSSADFDSDGDVDGADFLAWQRGFGTPVPTATKNDGDADNDTDVDNDDLTVWESQFGQAAPIAAIASANTNLDEGPLSEEVIFADGDLVAVAAANAIANYGVPSAREQYFEEAYEIQRTTFRMVKNIEILLPTINNIRSDLPSFKSQDATKSDRLVNVHDYEFRDSLFEDYFDLL